MSIKFVQANTLYQAGSGNIIGATSIVLTSFSDIYGNILTMSDFGSTIFFTAEPDTNNEESLTATGVSANANGTYTLTGVSSVLAKSPYTASSGTVRAHSGGTKVVLSDTTAFWNNFGNKQNDEALVGRWTTPVAPVANNDLVNKLYADNLAIAGAPNATTSVKGIGQLSTQAQLLAKTATGSTGAALIVTPDIMPSTLLSDYKADTGAADVYVITPAPAITAYTAGQRFSFKLIATNTTATPSLNVNGLGAKTIIKRGNATMVAGDLLIGQVVEVEYDGTNFQLMSPVATAPLTTATLVAYDYQSFTGNGTWTKPSGLTGTEMVKVQAWGGGGAGGGVNPSSASLTGAGGGGGAYVEMIFRASDLGSTETVTVGAVVAGTNSTGTVGNNTTFGSKLTAYGGAGGIGRATSTGGGGGGGTLAVGSAGSGGTGGVGGAPGGGAASTQAAGFGGSGGGSATTGAGAVYGGAGGGGGADTSATGANGGAAFYGGGGGGAGTNSVNGTGGNGGAGYTGFGGAGGNGGGSPSNSGTAGSAGSAPGGGGGGAGSNSATGNFIGGGGARGECRVWTIL